MDDMRNWSGTVSGLFPWETVNDVRSHSVAGRVFATIPASGEFNVEWLAQKLPDLTAKQLYNAVGYLNRKGKIQKISRGRYQR